jgi:hypothetical protein
MWFCYLQCYTLHTNNTLLDLHVNGCVGCEKFWRNFVAWTCVSKGSVQTVLHRSSCTNETVWCSQNMSLGSNGVDRVRSSKIWVWGLMGWIGCVRCRKIPTWVRCVGCGKFRRNFVARTCALKAPVRLILHWSSCSNETVWNSPKYEFGVQWGGLGTFVAKNSDATILHELVY